MSAYCTLLWLTSDRMVRADFTGGAGPAQVWQLARPMVDSLPLAVESALHLGGAPAGPVWVLATDLWMQTLAIDPAALATLSAEEVAKALAFEAESLSGMSGAEASLGHAVATNSEGRKEFWVVQQPTWQRDEIETLVARAGGRLAGMLHPGGLPAVLPNPAAQAASTGDWQRIELWPDAVVCIAGQRASGTIRLEVIPSDPRLNAWAEAADRWSSRCGQPADSETLSWSGDFGQATIERHRFSSLEDEATLRAWLTAWADQLTNRPAEVPHLAPPPRPLSAETRWTIAGALAVVAAIGCFAHMWSFTSETAVLREEIAQLDAGLKQKKTLDANKKTLEKQRDEVHKQVAALRDDVTVVRAAFAAQRQRWRRLLDLIARKKPTDLLVRGLESEGGDVLITGICLRPEQPVALAVGLADQLAPLGWQVAAPQQQAGALRPDGAPYRFELRLIEAPPTLPANSPPPESAGNVAGSGPLPAEAQRN